MNEASVTSQISKICKDIIENDQAMALRLSLINEELDMLKACISMQDQQIALIMQKLDGR